jgi:hypothetical protein
MFNLFSAKNKKTASPLNQALETQGPFKGGFLPKPVALDINFPTQIDNPLDNLDGKPLQKPYAVDDFDPHAPVNTGLNSDMQPDYTPANDGAFNLTELPVSDFTDADFSMPLDLLPNTGEVDSFGPVLPSEGSANPAYSPSTQNV